MVLQGYNIEVKYAQNHKWPWARGKAFCRFLPTIIIMMRNFQRSMWTAVHSTMKVSSRLELVLFGLTATLSSQTTTYKAPRWVNIWRLLQYSSHYKNPPNWLWRLVALSPIFPQGRKNGMRNARNNTWNFFLLATNCGSLNDDCTGRRSRVVLKPPIRREADCLAKLGAKQSMPWEFRKDCF